MVWQENIENIVMLTNLVEAGGPKCDMYWPRNDSNEIYGDIIVTCLQEDIFVDYTLRKFELKKKSSVRAVHHFHYMVWPDKGVPSDLSSIIDLRQKVLRSQSNLSGPTLVHCSAGVGRTGTYIALDILIEQGQHENGVEIFSCVRNLREQRVNMVQTVEQYQYIHDAVAYALFVDCKPIPEDRLKDLMDCSSIEDIGSIYENMQKMNDQKSKMEMDAVARNEMMSQQNREGADIPGDENRPRLYMNIIPGSSDYINAVYINGLKARNRYIVAQTPLPTTLEYFLTLIVQENCSVIVDMDNSQDQTCGRYLPEDGGSIQVGSFSVSVLALQTSEQFSSCKMILSHKSCTPAENRELHLYRYRGWNDNSSVPKSPTRFNDFIKDVESKLTEDNSVLVHCRTGAIRCGILCAVAVILQKLDIDGEVSIPNVVKQIKTRRSLAIPNKEQFVFCYECATEYIRYLTHTYANFVKRA
ncbi:receptor-type tyrosine-protein phosphatase kappa-like [Mercenaria mercenaria]|uniref:receptor-type tyrosine-protein phosphatase kappa-like n=1 Tax=Mercenaria mercenaria TaxID=6596 RepID=UPI00234ED2CA|nr:receptor-type tyrosine-protein phosphatase kappa-like [Mercenaria mercenaria]